MYCTVCQASIEDVGGSQLNECRHFFCTDCIVKGAKTTKVLGLKCAASKGIYKCDGYLDHAELEFMLPTEVYDEYVERISKLGDFDPDDPENPESDASKGASVLALPDELDLTEEEKDSGWAHVASLIDELVRYKGYSREDALNYVEELPIVETRQPFECPICLDEVPMKRGVVLRDCLHMFCKACLGKHIETVEKSAVVCPFVKDDYSCDTVLKPREVKSLVSRAEYQRHFEELSLREAASSLENVVHCLTPNCRGFCISENAVVFVCEVCRARNCLVCKVIHRGSCAEYLRQLEVERERLADNDNRVKQRENELLSLQEIDRRIATRIWMRCPRCSTAIEKNGGCAHMKCRSCAYDFNWTGL